MLMTAWNCFRLALPRPTTSSFFSGANIMTCVIENCEFQKFTTVNLHDEEFLGVSFNINSITFLIFNYKVCQDKIIIRILTLCVTSSQMFTFNASWLSLSVSCSYLFMLLIKHILISIILIWKSKQTNHLFCWKGSEVRGRLLFTWERRRRRLKFNSKL